MPASQTWPQRAEWWKTLATHLGVGDKGENFFHNAPGPHDILEQIDRAGGDLNYILFVLLRHWIPIVLPPPGRERTSKNDPDYWLESAQILNAAVARLRELKPLIDLLTASSPFGQEAPRSSPVVEVEPTGALTETELDDVAIAVDPNILPLPSPNPFSGCRYWIMLADNQEGDNAVHGPQDTADVVGVLVMNGRGRRIAHGAGPVVSGEVSISPSRNLFRQHNPTSQPRWSADDPVLHLPGVFL